MAGWSQFFAGRDPDAPLRVVAQRAGIRFGAAVSGDILAKEDDFAIAVARECNVVVPENDLKWDVLRPFPNAWDFTHADRLLSFATDHDIAMRGHTLVWHDALPDWVKKRLSDGDTNDALAFLQEHINTVVGRYQGKLICWDVVNEAVQPKDKRDDYLRDSPWLRAIGTTYIDAAFRFAAEADPDAKLIYNDYGAEFMGGQKAEAILSLVRGMQDRKVPLHGVGIQAHLDVKGWMDHPKLEAFCRAVDRMGLELMITELDVRNDETPDDVKRAEVMVAGKTREFLDVVMGAVKPTQILTWGLSSRSTWLNRPPMNMAHQPIRPLPFDQDFQHTMMWRVLNDEMGRFPAAPRRVL
jgi:endo-1,4-beta-xylanase